MGKSFLSKVGSALGIGSSEEAAPPAKQAEGSNTQTNEQMQSCIRYAKVAVKELRHSADRRRPAEDIVRNFWQNCTTATGDINIEENGMARNAFDNYGVAEAAANAAEDDAAVAPEEEAPAPAPAAAAPAKAAAKPAAKQPEIDPDAPGFGEVQDAGDVQASLRAQAKKKKGRH